MNQNKNYSEYRNQIIYNGRWVSNWFSNMVLCDIIIDGKKYNSTEVYYQSKKMKYEKDEIYISSLEPHKAKTEASKLEKKDNWDDVKIAVMMVALKEKYKQPYWKEQLLNTKNNKIVEWNNWGDKYWGVSVKDNLGLNILGKILMDIREEYKYKSLF